MAIIKPRTLSGFMELLPGKQIQFERMVSILRDTYSSYGFAPLDTPVIEDAQILKRIMQNAECTMQNVLVWDLGNYAFCILNFAFKS